MLSDFSMNVNPMWNLVLLGLATAAVVGGCLVPNRWLPPLPNDKLLHFASFAILSLLALRVADGRLQAALWLLGLLVLGWLIECLQMLVPDRDFCWRDMRANAAGILFAAACAQLYVVLA
ncbi:VanZ family protein [uncultured Massilia sp.]|uniref:VanZ family protein n=1 Tax=uncultured Massilia sp. TaxID=169973 RepID=UPI0025FF7D31|nr:VanZ family protein [uncultured Massilia sp.]